MPVSDSSTPAPRIRGNNPPPVNVDNHKRLKDEIVLYRGFAIVIFVAGVIVASLLKFISFTSDSWLPILLLVTAIGISGLLVYVSDKQVSDLEKIPLIYALDAYNTEFTSPLADRSTLRITLHFQIPRHLNIILPSPYGQQNESPHFVEQLNRITEAKLVRYTQRFTDPPSHLEIEDYLSRELAQFQDENNVPVLRLSVPIAIHVTPDKPRGVNV